MTKLIAPSHEWLLNEADTPWTDTGESLYFLPPATKNGTIIDKPGILGRGKVANSVYTDYIQFSYQLTEWNPLGTEFTLRILAQVDEKPSGQAAYVWSWRRTNSPNTWAFGFFVYGTNNEYLGIFVGISATLYRIHTNTPYPVFLRTGLHDIILVRKGAILRGYIDGCLLGTESTLPATTDIDIPGNYSTSRLFMQPGGSSSNMDNGMVDIVQYYDYALTHDEILALFDDPTPMVVTTSPGVGADANTEFYFDVVSAADGVGIDYSTCRVYVSIDGDEELAYNGSTDSFIGYFNGINSLRSAITDGFRFNFDTTYDIGNSHAVEVRLSIADNRGAWLNNYTWSFTTTARLARYVQQLGTSFAQSRQALWRMDPPNLGTIWDSCVKYLLNMTEYNTSIISVSESEVDFKRARRFNGSNAYAVVPYTSTLNIDYFMIRFFIRVQSIPTGRHVIACRSSDWINDPDELEQGWALWLEKLYDEATERYETRLCWGGGSPYGPTPYQYHVAKSPINDIILDYLPLGVWVELTAWFRNGSDTTYQYTQGPVISIDGIQVPLLLTFGNAWTYWNSTDAATPDLWIGGTPSGDCLEADIAEIQYIGESSIYIPRTNWAKYPIFRNALRTRLADKPSVNDDTEALWLFDNDTNPGQSGSTVEDETGNHDGTVQNGNFSLNVSPYRNNNNLSVNYDIGLGKNAEDTRQIIIPHHANLNDLTNGLTIEMALFPYGTSTSAAMILEKRTVSGNYGLDISVASFIPNIYFRLKDNNDIVLQATYDLRITSTNYGNVPRLMAFIYDPATKTIYIYDGDTVYPNGGEATNSSFNHNNFGNTEDLIIFGSGSESFKGIIYYISWERRVKPLNEIFNDVKGTIF